MNFDDEDKGALLKRSGLLRGHAYERVLLDNAQGSDSFKTSVRVEETVDTKITTILRTKGFMPQITTVIEGGKKTEEVVYGYMETGELTWGFATENTAVLYAPATWHFNDVPLMSGTEKTRWLGKVNELGKQKGAQPTPKDTGVLRDGIDSLAIGYPRQLNDQKQIDATADEHKKAEFGPHVGLKKLLCGLFPPEIFTGKLRKFMQAQYGSKLVPGTFPFTVELLGTSPLLQYQPEGKRRIQLYFWAHATTGLFTAKDYRYYLFEVTSGDRANTVKITGMPLLLGPFAKSVRRALLKGKIDDPVQIERAEAYIFADATIDTASSFHVGEVSVSGSLGALAWGWKFDSTGEHINLVSVWEVGDADSNSLDGRAAEYKITVDRSDVFDGDEAGKWALSVEDSGVMNWLDGWGYFNIMVPESETASTLVSWSTKITWGAVADYTFSNVPVYGFFDKENEWKTVRLSAVTRSGTKYEQRASGVLLNPAYAHESDTDYAVEWPWKETCIRNSNTAGWVEQRIITDAYVNYKQMTIAVDEWSYTGTYKHGTFYREDDVPLGGTAWTDWDDINYEGPMVGGGYSWYPSIASFSAQQAYIASRTDFLGGENSLARIQRGPIEFYQRSGFFDERHSWTLVLPAGDCEAVHVATNDYRWDEVTVNNVAYYDSWYAQEYNAHFYTIAAGHEWVLFTHPECWVKFRHWVTAPTFIPVEDPLVHEDVTRVYGWSRTLTGEAGSPSGSYTTLFSVDRSWPYFNGTIRFKESYGGRFHGTEGYNSGGVRKNSLFVGWY